MVKSLSRNHASLNSPSRDRLLRFSTSGNYNPFVDCITIRTSKDSINAVLSYADLYSWEVFSHFQWLNRKLNRSQKLFYTIRIITNQLSSNRLKQHISNDIQRERSRVRKEIRILFDKKDLATLLDISN